MKSIMMLLEKLQAQNVIRPLDYQFAKFVFQQSSGKFAQYEAWLAAIVSYELGNGHICFPLVDENGNTFTNVLPFAVAAEGIESFLDELRQVDWQKLILDSDVIGQPGNKTPLIFDGKRLYLHRYWFYESVLAAKLLQFNQQKTLSEQNLPALRASLDRLFPQSTEVNWQKVAAAVAISQSFAVISGGPGTGKTTTVAKLLAVLIEASQEQSQQPIIKLVAPTGKAAARLTESIGKAIDSLPVSPDVRNIIPTQAGTIHRLLGAIPNRANFRHSRSNPLHLDILIVDEASMVDLSLMYKLFDALPEHAKVILLGDKDQLASVEAGAVLGDICSFQSYGYSAKQASVIAKLTGVNTAELQRKSQVPAIADSLCVLQKSYRFDSHSGIGQLAKAVNSGDVRAVQAVLDSGYADINYLSLTGANYQLLVSKLIENYQAYLNVIFAQSDTYTNVNQRAQQALNTFSQCRLLCAVRDGDFGVTGINDRVEKLLKAKKIIRFQDESWYEGRPVMIVQNDYSLGVYNGDIGLCLRDETGRLKVYFELSDGSVKGFLPSRIPLHETAYAMTVHKSQGSEFETTMLILPPDFTPIITRELIYTGITRAKNYLYLLSSPTVLNRGTRLQTSRASGLTDLLG